MFNKLLQKLGLKKPVVVIDEQVEDPFPDYDEIPGYGWAAIKKENVIIERNASVIRFITAQVNKDNPGYYLVVTLEYNYINETYREVGFANVAFKDTAQFPIISNVSKWFAVIPNSYHHKIFTRVFENCKDDEKILKHLDLYKNTNC